MIYVDEKSWNLSDSDIDKGRYKVYLRGRAGSLR